tara:strand:+ start:223 stop:372 length:150 start_codon:yes stop_codon:yes gene_type:complete
MGNNSGTNMGSQQNIKRDPNFRNTKDDPNKQFKNNVSTTGYIQKYKFEI